ncbi:predicted protein [Chaetoceros tenuissimus]|uniref:Uncharacterized protein n=1 Tax=Chaetoceros tenuissimus TaxID=426638 RepID=A0AAD3D4T2_9STRA|nr:predicted protein [Chaetoceros tenuissimus]
MYPESERQRSKDYSSTCSFEIPIYNSDQHETSDRRHGRRGIAHEHNSFMQREQPLEQVSAYQHTFQERNSSMVDPDTYSTFKSSFEDNGPNNTKAEELQEPIHGNHQNSQRMYRNKSSIRDHFPPLPPLPNEHKRDVHYNRASDEKNFHLASAEVPYSELYQEENASSIVEKGSMYNATIHESLVKPTQQFCDEIIPRHASLQKKPQHESKRKFLHGETLPGPSNENKSIPATTFTHCRRSSAPMMRNPEYCLDFEEPPRMSKSCHSDHGSDFDDATFFDDLDLVTKLSEELGRKMSFDNFACNEEPQPYMPMHEHHGGHLEYSDDEKSLSSHEEEYDAISLHSAQRQYAGRSKYNSSQPFNPIKSTSEGYSRSEVKSASSYKEIPLQKMNNRSNRSVFSGSNSYDYNCSPTKRRSNVKQESFLESPTKRRMNSHHSSTNELPNQDMIPRQDKSMPRRVSQCSVNLFDEKKRSDASRPTGTVTVELSREMKKKMEERVQNLLHFMDATDWTRDELGRLEAELSISREDLLSGRKLY